MDIETTITEQWKPTDRQVSERVEKRVDLVGAPVITADSALCTPVSIRFLFFRVNGTPWRSQITIYADKPGGLVRKFFRPAAVHQPPAWLTDLIARATPEE